MPAQVIPTYAVQVTDLGDTHGTGINREHLSDILSLIGQTRTPLMATSSSIDGVYHTTYSWPEDSYRDPRTAQIGGVSTGSMVSGSAEGADFSAGNQSSGSRAPQRRENSVQEFRDDVLVTRRHMLMNPAGIRDTFGHYSTKVMVEQLRAVEARSLDPLQSTGASTGTPTLMKTLEKFADDAATEFPVDALNNTQTLGSAGSPGTVSEDKSLKVLESMAESGIPGASMHASPGVKRVISRTFTGIGGAGVEAPLVRNASAPNVLSGRVTIWETDTGDVELVWNPWVTKEDVSEYKFDGTLIDESNSVATGGLNEASSAGRVWFFAPGNIRFAWMDRFHTESIGKRGTSIGGIVTGTVTLVVGSTKGLGRLKRVANAA